MKPEWEEYLKAINVEGPYFERVEEILDFYEVLYPDCPIEDIFIEDYYDKDGNQQYGGLWLFSNKNAMEAKEFRTKDDYDSVIIRHQVRYWNIKKTEYDFSSVSEQSRMTVDFILWSKITGSLKAARENCNYLRDIFSKYILPNTSGYNISPIDEHLD